MSRLVVSEIVSQTCPTSRVQTIEKWTAVADICRCLHNFNGVLQICSAFSNSSVYRLKQTWTRRVTKAVSETETWNHFGISGSYALIQLDLESSFLSSLCLSFWEKSSRVFLVVTRILNLSHDFLWIMLTFIFLLLKCQIFVNQIFSISLVLLELMSLSLVFWGFLLRVKCQISKPEITASVTMSATRLFCPLFRLVTPSTACSRWFRVMGGIAT